MDNLFSRGRTLALAALLAAHPALAEDFARSVADVRISIGFPFPVAPPGLLLDWVDPGGSYTPGGAGSHTATGGATVIGSPQFVVLNAAALSLAQEAPWGTATGVASFTPGVVAVLRHLDGDRRDFSMTAAVDANIELLTFGGASASGRIAVRLVGECIGCVLPAGASVFDPPFPPPPPPPCPPVCVPPPSPPSIADAFVIAGERSASLTGEGSTFRSFSGSAFLSGSMFPGWTYVFRLELAEATSSARAGVIPEPATWALLIAGFGLTGVAIRRRRRAVGAPPA